MKNCDQPGCRQPSQFLIYAAYDAHQRDLGAVHPLLARDPAALARSCIKHVGLLCVADMVENGSTLTWVVRPAFEFQDEIDQVAAAFPGTSELRGAS